jgi:putative endonuclease
VDRKAEGDAREAQARASLERAGLRLVGSNVRYRVGELDLVMLDREVLVFVEVRYRREHDFGGALASVTRSKQQKLTRAATQFLAAHAQHARRACRFDVVAIGDAGTDWVRDAFRVDG